MLHKQHNSVVTLAILLALVGVSKPAKAFLLAQADVAPTTFTVPEKLSEKSQLTIITSDSTSSIDRSLQESFIEKYPQAEVNLEIQSSQEALNALAEGQADIAGIGRNLTAEEKQQGFIAVPVSREKIAIIVNKDNSYDGNLTISQFAQIFRGEITDWSEIGGNPGQITLVDAPDTNDTRQAFPNYPVFQESEFTTGSNTIKLDRDSTEEMISQLGTNGIGYAVANDVIDRDDVKIVTMHQTQPDDPRYPFSQPFYLVYQGAPKEVTEAFLGFATTEAGEEVVANRVGSTSTAAAAAIATKLGNKPADAPTGTVDLPETTVDGTGEVVQPNSDAVVEGDVDPDVDPDAVVEGDVDPDVDPDAVVEGDVDPDVVVEGDVNPDVDPDAVVEGDVDPDAVVEGDVNPDADPDAVVEGDVDPDAVVEGDVNPDVVVEGDVNPDVDPDAVVEGDVDPDLVVAEGEVNSELNGSGEANSELNGSGEINSELNGSGEINSELNGSGEVNPELNGSGEANPELNGSGELNGVVNPEDTNIDSNAIDGDETAETVVSNQTEVDEAVATEKKGKWWWWLPLILGIPIIGAIALSGLGRGKKSDREPAIDNVGNIDSPDGNIGVSVRPDGGNLSAVGTGAGVTENVGRVTSGTVNKASGLGAAAIATGGAAAASNVIRNKKSIRNDVELEGTDMDLDLSDAEVNTPAVEIPSNPVSEFTGSDTQLQTTDQSTRIQDDIDIDIVEDFDKNSSGLLDGRSNSAGDVIAGGTAAMGGAALASEFLDREEADSSQTTEVDLESSTFESESPTNLQDGSVSEQTTKLQTDDDLDTGLDEIITGSSETQVSREFNGDFVLDEEIVSGSSQNLDLESTVENPDITTPELETNLDSNIDGLIDQSTDGVTSQGIETLDVDPVDQERTGFLDGISNSAGGAVAGGAAAIGGAAAATSGLFTNRDRDDEQPKDDEADQQVNNSDVIDTPELSQDTDLDTNIYGLRVDQVDSDLSTADTVDQERTGFLDGISNSAGGVVAGGAAAIGGAAAATSGLFTNRDRDDEQPKDDEADQQVNSSDVIDTPDDNLEIEVDQPTELSNSERLADNVIADAEIISDDLDFNLDEITLDETDNSNDISLDEITFDDVDDSANANLDEITLDETDNSNDISLDEITFDDVDDSANANLDEITLDETDKFGDISLDEITFDDVDDSANTNLAEITLDETNKFSDINLDEITFDDVDVTTDREDIDIDSIGFVESKGGFTSDLSNIDPAKISDISSDSDDQSDDMDDISIWLDNLDISSRNSEDISGWLDSLNTNESVSESTYSEDTIVESSETEEAEDISFQFLEDLLDRDSKNDRDN